MCLLTAIVIWRRARLRLHGLYAVSVKRTHSWAWVVIVVSWCATTSVYCTEVTSSPRRCRGAWVSPAFAILAMWDLPAWPRLFLVWIAFIVGAAFANRHFLLASCGARRLNGGTGRGYYQGLTHGSVINAGDYAPATVPRIDAARRVIPTVELIRIIPA